MKQSSDRVQIPGHIMAVQILYVLCMVFVGLLVAVVVGSYLWVCGPHSPGACARAHGFVPAIEISTTKERTK